MGDEGCICSPNFARALKIAKKYWPGAAQDPRGPPSSEAALQKTVFLYFREEFEILPERRRGETMVFSLGKCTNDLPFERPRRDTRARTFPSERNFARVFSTLGGSTREPPRIVYIPVTKIVCETSNVLWCCLCSAEE